jgi:hypothetical protein
VTEFYSGIDQDLNLLECYLKFRPLDKHLNLCEHLQEIFVIVVMIQNVSEQLIL